MNSELKWSGTAGFRWVQCSCSTRPRPPPTMSSLSATYSVSYRRMKPTWTRVRPSAASFCTSSYEVATSVVSGFSQSTGLPASRQRRHLLEVGAPRGGQQHRVDLRVVDRGDRVGYDPGPDPGGHRLGLVGHEVVDHGDGGALDRGAEQVDVEGAHHAETEDGDTEVAHATGSWVLAGWVVVTGTSLWWGSGWCCQGRSCLGGGGKRGAVAKVAEPRRPSPRPGPATAPDRSGAVRARRRENAPPSRVQRCSSWLSSASSSPPAIWRVSSSRVTSERFLSSTAWPSLRMMKWLPTR